MRKFDKQKFKAKNEYLEKNIYYGLTNLNTGWDAPSIYYFSESDFEIILNRVEKLNVGIYGLEPFDVDNHYYDVKLFDDYSTNPCDPNWYRKAFQGFNTTGEKLQYAASYYVPHLDDE